MKEQNNFDQYINKIFKDEWTTPDELAWEHMDIPIPKKRSKKRGLLILIPFAFLVSSVLIYSLLNTNNPSLVVNQNQTPDTSTIVEQNKLVDVKQSTKSEHKLQTSNTSTPTKTITNSIDKTPAKNAIATQKEQTPPNQTITTNKKLTATVPNPSKQTIHTTTTTINTNRSSSYLPTEPTISIENQQTNQQKPSNQRLPINERTIEQSPTNNQPPIAEKTIKKTVNKTIVFLPSKPMSQVEQTSESLTFESLNNKKKLSKSASKSIAIFAHAGPNTYTLKTQTDSLPFDQLDASNGLSISLGFRAYIRPKTSLSIGFQYDEYHSIFQHRHEARTYSSADGTTQIVEFDRHYHNNYTRTAGISLGLNQHLPIAKWLEASGGIYLAPSYRLNSTGKTVFNNTVVELSDLPETKKFNLGYGVTGGIAIPVHSNLKLTGGYQLQLTSGKGVFINQTAFSKMAHRYVLGVEVLFGK